VVAEAPELLRLTRAAAKAAGGHGLARQAGRFLRAVFWPDLIPTNRRLRCAVSKSRNWGLSGEQ